MVPYLTIVAFAILEGEIYYSKACADAMIGNLNWVGVWCAGALGGSAGDQFWFYLLRGRIHWLDRYPKLRKYRDRVSVHVHAHEGLMVLAGRFLPGLRSAIPIACAYAGVGRIDHVVREARIADPQCRRAQRMVGPADPGAIRDPLFPLARPAGAARPLNEAPRLYWVEIAVRPPRSTNFCIFPVAVFGSSVTNFTVCGALKCASRSRVNARSSSEVAVAPGFNTTNACGASPHRMSGMPTTAASCTAGCRSSTPSTSTDEMFSPPLMMTSFKRSRISA